MSTCSRSATSDGVAVGPHVEPDDDRVGGRGQQHVRLVDGPDAGVDDADLDLLVRELVQRVGEHLGRPLHVGLDDDRQFLDLALGDLLLQRLEGQARGLRRLSAFSLACVCRKSATWRALAASAIAWNESPGCGRPARPSTSTGVDGPASFTCRAAIVDERPDLADDRTGDDGVADAQRAVLHEHGGHRAAPAVELGLEHRARRPARFGVRLQLEDVGDQQHHLEQRVEVLAASWPRRPP